MEAAASRKSSKAGHRKSASATNEWIAALTIIGTATLATLIALLLTSRPYDPMNSTVAPQQVVPAAPAVTQTSPRASPTQTVLPQVVATPLMEPSPEPTVAVSRQPDDATIQAQIEKLMASDPVLSQIDVSTLVENGTVTLVGSVRSADIRQRVERLVRSVKGVITVDNQLIVTDATP